MNWSEKEYQAHLAKRKSQPEQEGCAIDSMNPQPKKRTMNGTERRYADYVLEPSRHVGEIDSWMYEGLRFKLADGAWYKPDFNVFYPDGQLINIEIKGGIIHEATVVRIKVAREAHLWCKFQVWQWKGGAWLEKNRALGSSI